MTFNQPVKRFLKRLLPYMPEPLLSAAIRRRPGLIYRIRLPAGRSFRWPYYRDDLNVWIDPASNIERSMPYGYDDDVIQSVQRFVGPDACVVDVGVNVGAVTLLMARLVGSGGRVLAVEPGPPLVERLRANLALNPAVADRVTIHQVGLSDAPGTLIWQPNQSDIGNASLHPDSGPGGITVPVTTLDALAASWALDRLDFIKIDVEGMELEVLRGARRTLETLRPVVLFETMEVFRVLRRERTGIADLFAEIECLLHEVGYRLCALRPDGTLEDVTSAGLPYNTLGIPGRHEDTSNAPGSVPPAPS